MAAYADTHSNPQGPGDARPTALQIIRDEGLEGKLVGKVMVITGSSSGIGIETARALSATGATLFLTARDPEKAKAALKNVLEPGRVVQVKMDNTSLASVRSAAAEILSASKNRVNILINNAGIMGVQEHQLTEDGLEIHFAVNYLSHFLLFQLLRPALLASATPDFHSRVVNVSSSGHRAAQSLNESNNYNFEKGGYFFRQAYANSKLSMIYMTNEIDRRYGAKGLHATSLHPGGITTNISRYLGQELIDRLTSAEPLRKAWKNSEQGAATAVLAAVGKEWEDKGGKYLEDCEEAKRGADDGNVFGTGYIQATYDPVQEGRLYKDSLKLVGMQDDVS